jgi:hypothetical protein
VFPRQVLEDFDAFLASCSLRLEASAICGGALVLLGRIDRRTLDLNILHPELASEVVEAARMFASRRGCWLAADWLNNGPMSLVELLPPGWQARLQPAFAGQVITLHTLGRADLLKTKLLALCDRGTDLVDCIALAPSAAELEEATPWVCEQDANEQWPDHVRAVFGDLAVRLNHAV